MSQQNLAIMTLTVAAGGAVAAGRFVTVAATQAGAAANTLGVARFAVASSGMYQFLAVDVLGIPRRQDTGTGSEPGQDRPGVTGQGDHPRR